MLIKSQIHVRLCIKQYNISLESVKICENFAHAGDKMLLNVIKKGAQGKNIFFRPSYVSDTRDLLRPIHWSPFEKLLKNVLHLNKRCLKTTLIYIRPSHYLLCLACMVFPHWWHKLWKIGASPALSLKDYTAWSWLWRLARNVTHSLSFQFSLW